MRLSEWRAGAPTRDAMTAKVLAVVEPVIDSMGAEPDPHCWVAWAEDPSVRYTIFAPVAPGLVVCSVRVNVPGEGPRASAKLVRWSRVQVGEFTVETQAGHRVGSFQVEQQVIRAADAGADRVARFALAVLAAIDGRTVPDLGDGRARRSAGRGATATKAGRATAAKPRDSAAGRATPARSATNGAAGRHGSPTRALGPGTSPSSGGSGSPKPA